MILQVGAIVSSGGWELLHDKDLELPSRNAQPTKVGADKTAAKCATHLQNFL